MTRRRSGASRLGAILAASLVAIVFVGLAVADAAQLNVGGQGIFIGSQARCTNGPVAITGSGAHSGSTYSEVSLAGLTGCDGLAVQFTVFGATGNSMVTGSGTAGADPLVISTANYAATDVAGVALLVGTGGVPTTWIPPACTATPIALAPGSPVGGSGKYRAVIFSSVNANCTGGAVAVSLYNSAGGLLATASGTLPTLLPWTLSTGGQYYASQVVSIVLTVDGFTIPTTWTP